MDAAAVIVLTTVPENLDAAAMARVLVEERLAACVNILPPMMSVYRWDGQVEEAAERQLVIKTIEGTVDALRERLSGLHPYDVPEFLVLPVTDGADSYLSWLRAAVTGG